MKGLTDITERGFLDLEGDSKKRESGAIAPLFARYREGKADCFYGTFGHTETAFLTKIVFNTGLIPLKGDCLRRTYLNAVSASRATFFINNRYHQSTIPKRYPSCIALLSRLGFLASPMKYNSLIRPCVPCLQLSSGFNKVMMTLSVSIDFSPSGPDI
jgi:hypothetical protein